ncbi:MAG: RNA-binding transcriptional accessory protein, partial [Anaerofustis stercorihominis]|nr:RNA-binding transcriptional accessory protein [Anaerofustis stercorihominis]
MNRITQTLAAEFSLEEQRVESTIKLIDEGNTIPFIARYRKEVTGNMSDEILRAFDERLKYLTALEQRKEDVIRLIDKQEKLTKELEEKIFNADSIKDVDDLYLPFRPKKRTRASIAIEKGLEQLANDIESLKFTYEDIVKKAESFINEEKGVKSADDALNGAKDILAERISEVAEHRKMIREMTMKYSMISSVPVKGMENEVNEFQAYYEYSESVRTIPDHRILALNRGEDKKVLKVILNAPVDTVIAYLRKMTGIGSDDILMNEVIADSYKRLISPSIEREVRGELTQRAQESAITVFARNLKALLMAPPLKGKVIMGLDPAFRTGCKIAVIDENGKYLDSTTVYPTEPQKKIAEAKKILLGLIEKYGVEVISIGNGTASRESEVFVAEMIRESGLDIDYVIVNEAGASVYSASEFATKEYPELNVSLRGAISIAQRLKDPLSELVKIEPQHIGVGQYQHDVNHAGIVLHR